MPSQQQIANAERDVSGISEMSIQPPGQHRAKRKSVQIGSNSVPAHNRATPISGQLSPLRQQEPRLFNTLNSTDTKRHDLTSKWNQKLALGMIKKDSGLRKMNNGASFLVAPINTCHDKKLNQALN